jgi:hypothetical protein
MKARMRQLHRVGKCRMSPGLVLVQMIWEDVTVQADSISSDHAARYCGNAHWLQSCAALDQPLLLQCVSLLRWLHKFQLPAALARGRSFAGQACGGVVLPKKHFQHLQLENFAATRMGLDRLVWAQFSKAMLPISVTAAIIAAAASPSRSAGLQHLLKRTKMTGNSPLMRALAYDVKSRRAYCELQPDHVALVPVEVLMQPRAKHEGSHETGRNAEGSVARVRGSYLRQMS